MISWKKFLYTFISFALINTAFAELSVDPVPNTLTSFTFDQ